jgi:hypothetical protein
MNCRLVWPRYIERQLGAHYLRAKADGYADEFTAATHRIEMLLATDPATAGESRAGIDRIVIDWRVVLWYRIDEPNHAVVITGVNYAR